MSAPREDATVERALVVAAHPDDADFGCSGALARWTDAGIEVTLLVITRGEQGGLPDADASGVPALREAEQRAASARLGVRDVRCLDGYRDGWLEPTLDLQREIVRVLRDVRPQRVLCQSPERWYDRLPDLEVFLRDWGARVGGQFGLGEGRLGEMFGIVPPNG